MPARWLLASIVTGSALLNGPMTLQASDRPLPSPSTAAPRPLPSPEAFRHLIRRLDSENYDDRRVATQELRSYGEAIIPLLDELATDADGEARLRIERLIQRLKWEDHEQGLARLLSHLDEPAPDGLAGWVEYESLAGNSPAARQLFVEMSRTEPELMSALARQDPELRGAIELRLSHLRHISRNSSPQTATPPSIAALLLVSHYAGASDRDPDGFSDRGTSLGPSPFLLSQLLRQGRFGEAVRAESETGEVLRRLVGAWVRDPRSAGAVERLQIGGHFSLPECVAPARELLSRRPEDHRTLQASLLLLARHGTIEHVPELESWLDDETEITAVSRVEPSTGRSRRVSIRVQDMALLAMILLTRQEPATYGFHEVKPHDSLGYTQSSAGFESDESRETAHRQWQKWRALNLDRALATPLEAAEGRPL